jgi:hypothetical protein
VWFCPVFFLYAHLVAYRRVNALILSLSLVHQNMSFSSYFGSIGNFLPIFVRFQYFPCVTSGPFFGKIWKFTELTMTLQSLLKCLKCFINFRFYKYAVHSHDRGVIGVNITISISLIWCAYVLFFSSIPFLWFHLISILCFTLATNLIFQAWFFSLNLMVVWLVLCFVFPRFNPKCRLTVVCFSTL